MKMICKVIILLVIICTTSASSDEEPEEPVDFSQHQLIRIFPKRHNHLKTLGKIEHKFNVSYWNPPMPDLRPVLALISPEQSGFLSSLNKSNIQYEVKANNFQKVIDAERDEYTRNRLTFSLKAFDYDKSYHSYEEIVSELKSISSSNNKTHYKSIGSSSEGREIPLFIITNPGGKEKRSIFLECGIHAREWVSPATCLWIINKLLNDNKNSAFLDKFEFLIVPTLNPDGYVYTHTINRTWRKNKSKSRQNGRCFGVDPNRNWDSQFCKSGATSDPCSDAYCGPNAFSEMETKSMSNLIKSKKGNIAAYFAIHSYSQLWMYPYGYTRSLSSNNAVLNRLSTAAARAIYDVNGLTFKTGTISNAIYPASGNSIDWAYDNCNVTVAFAIELRDKGQHGFVLPASQINAAASEAWAGIRSVCSSV